MRRRDFPKLADVQCSRLQFEPGDRILVKYFTDLSREQRIKLHKAVHRWAGDAVEVLLIDARQVSIEVDKLPLINKQT